MTRRPLRIKPVDQRDHQLPDQSDTLVIPIAIGGIRGAITARFIDFRSFHAQPDSQQEKHHHVAR